MPLAVGLPAAGRSPACLGAAGSSGASPRTAAGSPPGGGGRCWDGVFPRCSPPVPQPEGLPSSPASLPSCRWSGLFRPLSKGRGWRPSLVARCGRGRCPLGRAAGKGTCGLSRPCATVSAGAKPPGSVWKPVRPPRALPAGEGAVVRQGAVFGEPCVGREGKKTPSYR